MALKNLLRLGSDINDIDGKNSAHYWIHPEGKIYARKSYINSMCGWKPSGNKIYDYWQVEWYEMIPAKNIPIEDIVFN